MILTILSSTRVSAHSDISNDLCKGRRVFLSASSFILLTPLHCGTTLLSYPLCWAGVGPTTVPNIFLCVSITYPIDPNSDRNLGLGCVGKSSVWILRSPRRYARITQNLEQGSPSFLNLGDTNGVGPPPFLPLRTWVQPFLFPYDTESQASTYLSAQMPARRCSGTRMGGQDNVQYEPCPSMGLKGSKNKRDKEHK